MFDRYRSAKSLTMSGDMEESQMVEETPVEEKVTPAVLRHSGPRINRYSSNRSAVDFVAASGSSKLVAPVLVGVDVLCKY